ncbi:MAG: sigma-54-dependent Fis family transcriptional regulator [Planctomycetaceae bacterium]|nr:sigma-54-dependent Fis family transcriptional regulator [Planctomycetaceae bacterium]
MASERILIADDEPHVRSVIATVLEREDYKVVTAGDGESAIAELQKGYFDLVLCDMRMPKMDGFHVLQWITANDSELPVIMITAHGTIETAIEAMKIGARDFLLKPFDMADLVVTVRNAIENTRLRRQNTLLRRQLADQYDFSNIVGRSKALRETLEQVKAVIDVNATVLLTGESGSGKDLIARAIHYNGPRKAKPMITINCGAIPPELMESELFGHVRGAFTGAERDKRGLFEEADGSAIFLDEIGELPIHLQPKLLRVLQDGEFTKVGATRPLKVNARVIAATNRDLWAEVEAGNFREDLYYRLNVIRVQVPSLRERKDDIVPLANHFLAAFAAKYQRPARSLTQAACDELLNFRWPGNVRELSNVIEQAVILHKVDVLDVAHLNLPKHPEFDVSKDSSRWVAVPEGELTLKEMVSDVVYQVEKSKIGEALERTDGNRTKAARMLGISLRNLMYKLKELDIG